MAKAQTFTDSFPGGTVDTGKWELTGTPAVVSGAMLLDGTDEAKSLTSYDIGDSYFSAKVTMGAPVNGALLVTLNSSLLAFAIDTNIAPVDFLGALTITGSAVAYNATNHAWLRIRQSSSTGLIYWETSPDGTAWSTLATAPYTGDMTAWLAFAPSSGTMTIDNVNVSPVVASTTGFFPFFRLAPEGAPAGSTDPSGEAVNRPANPLLVAYADDNVPSSGVKAAWSHPGALIVCGRNNYGAEWLKDCAAAGATVLMYFHAALTNANGRYADLFYNSSAYGVAASLWPANSAGSGPWVVDEWGSLPNFKVTQTAYYTKLDAVLNLALDENPHVSGFFMDGLGSRHWPGAGGFDWDTWPEADQEAYRAGEIKIAQTVRDIADERDLMVIGNGVWQGGGIDVGGGYPDRSLHGCSLIDGAMMENRAPDGPGDFAYEYARSSTGQWGLAIPRIADMPAPRGYIISSNDGSTERDSWASSGAVSHAYSGDFSTLAAPWTSTFTDFNLPNRAT